MARLWTAGAEANDNTVEQFTSNGVSATAYDTGTFRSGARSFKFDTTGANQTTRSTFTVTYVLGTTYYARGYFNFTTLPTVAASTLILGPGNYSVTIKSDNKLYLRNGTTDIGSASAALTTGVWYRVELGWKIDTGAADYAELMLDGVSIASETGANRTDTPGTNLSFGTTTAYGASVVIYLDDLALNDSTGSSQNSWPGDGKVVMSLPITDSARDTLWTGGAGGTSSLWNAVDNTPPAGLASASATNTSQIEHAGGAAGTTDRYDAVMNSPTLMGVPAGSTINVALFVEADGEDIATGAKLLNFEVLSNPVIASPGNVTAGNGSAVGTYPTNWVVRFSSPVYDPTVALGTSPVMRVRRPETASRVASVCFMGIIFDYTPPTPLPILVTQPYRPA